jgi:8-oxo-dGTP diphosphatase
MARVQERTVVVGAAVVVDGRLLAARRPARDGAPGGWELPGGKVEPGESPERALVREVAEELGCTVTVTGTLAGEAPIGDTMVLRVLTAELTDGQPAPHEHDAIRWLGAAELDSVDWLAPDRPFLDQLRKVLEESR